jgi:hypothetical protein
MNRNNEAHFNQIPKTYVSRSRFKRDQNVKLTFDAGKLIPFYVDEVLPGDTFSVDTIGLVRMTTPIVPVMDNCYLDVYYFFVPNRIVWENWKEFCGENTTEAWAQSEVYSVPQINIGVGTIDKDHKTQTKANATPAENSILDYMGIPTKINTGGVNDKLSINALPVRGYVKIWNEWFRDQNLDDPVPELTGDDAVDNNAHIGTGWTQTKLNELAIIGDECLPVNKFHDYFTSALPAPQKGPEVTIPMTGNAPIYWADRDNNPLTIQDLKDNGLWKDAGYLYRTLDKMMTQNYKETTEKARAVLGSQGSGTKLGDRMTADLSGVTAATINELRQAFAVQHYYEALARGGSRYREIIRSLFGTLISDKTVQIPEYLGGGRYMINVSQVIQTSESGKTPQGNPGAVSVTPFNENSFTKSFEEHGFVIGVCCVRHDRTYQQGLERFWSRKDTLDFYYPQFANIGEQAVKVKEVYCDSGNPSSANEEVFGYQEAWSEYRMKPNRVSGLFRSNAVGTLDSWHYADNYDKRPYLSDEWLKEGKAEIQRTLAVQDEPQFIADFLIKNTTTRPMPLYSVPGLEKL